MRIVVGADHRGYSLKGTIAARLRSSGHEVLDVGTDGEKPVDYPDFALAVGKALLNGEAERGILVCGSGVGASIAANRLSGVRAGLCHDTYSAHQGVEHDDMNMLCLGSRGHRAGAGPGVDPGVPESHLQRRGTPSPSPGQGAGAGAGSGTVREK